MAKVEAVIFDMDGTLIDSVDQHAWAWVRAFQQQGLDFSFAEVRHEIGKGSDQLLPDFLDSATQARIGDVVTDAQSAIFKRDYMDSLKPFAGVRALFERLHAEGIRCVLGSSGQAGELARKVELCGIGDLVDASTSADDAEHSKPRPDIFLAALKKIDPIGAEAAVVIGDTPYDAQAALGAGLRTIGVLSGGFAEAELREAGCIAVYRDVAELLAQLPQSPVLA